jgi:predicted TPR repeat methyltransferase
MQRSPELEALIQELFDAMLANDVAALEQTLSRADGSVAIGTDAIEYTRDIDAMLKMVRDSMPAQSQITFSVDDARGYEEGSVGWVDLAGRFEHEGQSIDARMTGVVHKEDGQWRFVQLHSSIGVPTEHMFDPMFQTKTAVT